MSQQHAHEQFTMLEPGEYGYRTRYGFWFSTDNPQLFIFLAGLPCVYDVVPAPPDKKQDDNRCLVEIFDSYDPDEAWHWIRTDLENELNDIKLDSMWHDAIKWIL